MKTFIVDSFTHEAFKGNPAGVCFPERALTDTTMLSIAQELSLSETAFVRDLDSDGRGSIRYFSPKTEIPLCGHATLASAKVLFEMHGLGEAQFVTGQGIELPVTNDRGRIVMEFPIYDTRPSDAPPALLAALGIDRVDNVAYNDETRMLLLEISDTHVLAHLAPDFAALQRSHDSIAGVLVTASSDAGDYDFHSRYFWPWSGTNEDPVTGGTHTFLAPYWAARLGRRTMRSFQASHRTGSMEVELLNDRLLIRGQAVIVLEGRIVAPTS